MKNDLCGNTWTPEVADLLRTRLGVRKNRHDTMKLAEWMYGQGLQWRGRKGFGLVRGSDRDDRFGLKERADIQELGLTESKIRGAIKTLREVGWIVDLERAFDGIKVNFRHLKRRAACRFRMAPDVMSVIVKAKARLNAALREARTESKIACAAVAAKLRRSAAEVASPRENPFCSTPSRRSRTGTLSAGELASDRPQTASGGAQEPPGRAPTIGPDPAPRPDPSPPETDFDRRMAEITRRVEAGIPPERRRPMKPPRNTHPSDLDRHLGALIAGILGRAVMPDADPEPSP